MRASLPVFMGFHILAAVRALEGQDFEYPLIGDLVRKLRMFLRQNRQRGIR